ncbi:hypothetical protein [Spirosoma gilvum]
MKPLYIIHGTLLFLMLQGQAAMAQRTKRFSNYDAISTYRIATQHVNLGDLNQALQQAGYTPLGNQFTTLSVLTQITRPNRALALHTEFGMAFASTVNNSTYKARVGFYSFKLGTSYQIIGSKNFHLAPQLGLLWIPFSIHVSPTNTTSPSLNTVLTNPGTVQTATLGTIMAGLDAGLTANYRFGYKEQQTDCSTIERSYVIGLDAGYRFTGRSPLDRNQEVSTTNPAVQLSGWYVGIRFGFGASSRPTASPVTY